MTINLELKKTLLEVFIRVFVASFIGIVGSWAFRGFVDIHQAAIAALIFLLFNIGFEILRHKRK